MKLTAASAPVVSVILTVYKRTEFLQEAIQSVLAQSLGDLELIVTDDAPTEAARTICAKYGADPRLRYRRNGQTVGCPLNIAAAMREARGKYVTILNDDDVAEPLMLEKLVNALQLNQECILCFADHWIIDDGSRLLLEASDKNSLYWGRKVLKPGVVRNPLPVALRGSVPFVMGTLFRRDAYREEWLLPDVVGAYDQWLALQFAMLGSPFFYVAERIFKYRVHLASESARSAAEKAQCQVFIFRSLLEANLPAHERRIAKSNLSRFLFTLGRDRLYFNESSAARAAFREAIVHGLILKPILGIMASLIPENLRRLIFAGWRRSRGIQMRVPAVSASRF